MSMVTNIILCTLDEQKEEYTLMSGYSKSPDWSGIIIGIIIGVLVCYFVING